MKLKMQAIVALCLGVIFASDAIANGKGNTLGPKGSVWATGGATDGNTRNNKEVNLKPSDVENIMEAWSVKLEGDPWTQPTVAWGKVFLGDNKGFIYAFDAASGAQIWKQELRDYWDVNGGDNPTNDANDPNDPNNVFPNPKPGIAATRSALAARYSKVHGRTLIFGDQAGNPTLGPVPFNGANVYLINADTGELLVMTKLANNDPLAKNDAGQFPAEIGADFTVLTGAMAIAGDKVITGVAGLAEANPGCRPLTDGGCTLRGKAVALNADTLALEWETYMTPDVKGFTGASVWQSTPAVSMQTGMVYVGTGDNYTTPYDGCYVGIDKTGKSRDEIEAEFISTCIDGDPVAEADWARNYVDSIVALDLDSGAIKWVYRTLQYDTWNLACLGGPTLPDGTPVNWLDHCGPDMDFSHHPMLCRSENGKNSMLVVGQKSGIMRGLDPETGALKWETDGNAVDIFDEGLVGGFQWGAACTRQTVVGLAANSYAQQHDLEDGSSTTGGTMVGFDTKTGEVLYEVAPDTSDVVHPGLQSVAALIRGLGAIPEGGPPAAIGAVSCAGRVCGWGTTGKFGSLILSDIKTGETLWTRDVANGSVLWGGAFVRLPSQGTFWLVGSGYPSFDTGVGSDGTNPNFWAFKFIEGESKKAASKGGKK